MAGLKPPNALIEANAVEVLLILGLLATSGLAVAAASGLLFVFVAVCVLEVVPVGFGAVTVGFGAVPVGFGAVPVGFGAVPPKPPGPGPGPFGVVPVGLGVVPVGLGVVPIGFGVVLVGLDEGPELGCPRRACLGLLRACLANSSHGLAFEGIADLESCLGRTTFIGGTAGWPDFLKSSNFPGCLWEALLGLSTLARLVDTLLLL